MILDGKIELNVSGGKGLGFPDRYQQVFNLLARYRRGQADRRQDLRRNYFGERGADFGKV